MLGGGGSVIMVLEGKGDNLFSNRNGAKWITTGAFDATG